MNYKYFQTMPSLCSLWSIAFLVYAFETSHGLEFAPTPTWATLQSSALGWANLPAITAGASHAELKARAPNEQNPICGWIEGNGGTRTSLLMTDPISRNSRTRLYMSVALTFHFAI